MYNKFEIADNANLIVNGYAFTLNNGVIRIFNLNRDGSACILSRDGEVLETCMDDIELSIVTEYFNRNKQYLMED